MGIICRKYILIILDHIIRKMFFFRNTIDINIILLIFNRIKTNYYLYAPEARKGVKGFSRKNTYLK